MSDKEIDRWIERERERMRKRGKIEKICVGMVLQFRAEISLSLLGANFIRFLVTPQRKTCFELKSTTGRQKGIFYYINE